MEIREIITILKKQTPVLVQPLFSSIREFCLSLGGNVIEDIRMRIVFPKTMTFRWFVDVEPKKESIMKVQKNRKEHFQILEIKTGQDITECKKIIKDTFETIN